MELEIPTIKWKGAGKIAEFWLCTVAHACVPVALATWEVEVR